MKKLMIFLLTLSAVSPRIICQTPPAAGPVPDNVWEVNVRRMPPSTRAEISEAMEKLKGTAADRGIISDVAQAVGMGIVGGIVDAVVTETYNLAQYRKRQKQEWMRMIQNENNYTDSISSIKGLKDFYNSNSFRGALDPSDINFDGIEIRGMRNGQEVLYMACSIDKDRLDHMFRHSKFNLVLDTLAFYPYQCHLPNVAANGIRIIEEIKKGKASVDGDAVIRPGAGGNSFSFEERKNLKVGIDFSIFSSWINEAVQIHKNVELGNFKFTVNIPDSVREYTYSRRKVVEESMKRPEGKDREQYLNEHILAVEGDCFVVPRSFMPVDGGRRMWGTGEYDIKVKFRESCRFDDNSEKAKHWKKDYKRLRQMQNRSGEVQEYFRTLWNQYGNTLVKSSYKTALSTAATDMATPLFTGGAAVQTQDATPSAGQQIPAPDQAQAK